MDHKSAGDPVGEIEKLENELMEGMKRLAALRKSLPPEPVKDYALKDWEGREAKLSELFGDKRDLILIHNMGKSCRYCTLWADGFVSLKPHFENRAAFVVVSPDEPDVQREFATGRGWTFRMLSGADSSFIKDMGYLTDKGHYQPGVSTFYKQDDGSIVRIAHSYFGPGDPYCNVWHFFDLLKDGDDGWAPQYKYR